MAISWKRVVFFLVIVALVLLLLNNAHAAEGELIKSITNKFESVTNSWHANLRPSVIKLFWILATISFTYTAITMTLRGADFPDIMLEVVKMILLFGLWIYIIENSIDIVNAIINSLTKAANIAAGVSSDISPGAIINSGIDLATKIIDQAGFWNTPIYGILALVALIAYFYIAATIFVVLIESYVVTGAGIILLGFAGSPWTSDIAKKYLIFAFSVGVKLFATIMVARFGEELVRDQLTATSSMKQIFAVTGVICMIAYLTNRIPAMTQAMLSGASSSSPSDVRGIAATAGKAATAAALAATGTGAAIYQAGKAAANDMKSGGEGGGLTDTLSAATMPGGSSKTESGGDKDKGAIPDAIVSSNRGGGQESNTPTSSAGNESSTGSPTGDSAQGQASTSNSPSQSDSATNNSPSQGSSSSNQSPTSSSASAASSAETTSSALDESASTQNGSDAQTGDTADSSAIAAAVLGTAGMTPTVTPAGGSSLSPSKMKSLASHVGNKAAKAASTADKATKVAPQFLRLAAKHYAKGSASAMAENMVKPKHQRTPFSVAKKIYEQSLERQIKNIGDG